MVRDRGRMGLACMTVMRENVPTIRSTHRKNKAVSVSQQRTGSLVSAVDGEDGDTGNEGDGAAGDEEGPGVAWIESSQGDRERNK